MICINKEQGMVEGDRDVVITEASCLLAMIRDKDAEAMPIILSTIYTNAGRRTLKETLKEFKKDTTATLRAIELIAKEGGK